MCLENNGEWIWNGFMRWRIREFTVIIGCVGDVCIGISRCMGVAYNHCDK